LVFAALGFLAILVGGHVRVSLGGLVFLFLVGGVIGLVMFAAYKRGRRDGAEP
jgi:hypothetical protein